MPLILVTLIAVLFSATGMYAYAQVQVSEHTFTRDPENLDSPVYTTEPAAGDLRMRVTFPLSRLVEAMDSQVPAVFYEASENQRLIPYWSIDEIDMRVNFRAERLGPALVNLFGSHVEVIQPARLFVTGQAPDVEETETRDFILASRYALTLGEDWQIRLDEVEPPRVLGLHAPRLFASVAPDMSALTLWLNQDLAANLTEGLNREVNKSGGMRALIKALVTDMAVEQKLSDGQIWPRMGIRQAHLVAQRLDRQKTEFDLVLTLDQSVATTDLPPLRASTKVATPLEVPFTFSASVAELAGLLTANERQLDAAGGSLQVNKIKILRPHGDAMLVKVDATDINPGGHQFKKRGTFHILARVAFNSETKTIRFSGATMPETDNQLSFALQGRSWLQSDELASGLVSGLEGIARQGVASALVEQIQGRMNRTQTLPSGQLTWALEGFTFRSVPTTYSDTSVAANFRARLNALVSVEL